jgi:competence protein ComEC
MSSSKIVLYLCLSFIGGIFISSFLNVPSLIIGELFILGIFYSLFFFKQKPILVFGFCLIILAFGILRYQIALNNFENAELKNFIDFPESIQILARVVKEPDVRENNINLTVNTEELLINKIGIPMEGKILITTERYPEYQYGNKLEITGLLKTPPVFEDFNYKDYLRKEGILAVMSYPEISQRSSEIGILPTIYAKVLSFKNKLRETINQNLSPPQRSILAAVILGDKKNISKEWKDKLNKTGVRHITAVSGMHIIILTSILMTLLIALGFWRGQAFYLTIGIIFLYILMIGFQPSAVRAAIMASLFLLAQKIGRISYSQRAIIFAGALMLTQNPFLLKDDVGFQLSFLAIMGIIYLLPIFQKWLKFIPQGRYLNLRNILGMTFSAQVFTLPILIYNFGYFSLVSPLSNILIVPILSYVMATGFIFSLIGIFWQFLGWILSFPCLFLLTYITKVIDLLYNFPFISVQLKISWQWIFIFYLILGYFVWRLKERERWKFLDF